jgi:hypothetical protein
MALMKLSDSKPQFIRTLATMYRVCLLGVGALRRLEPLNLTALANLFQVIPPDYRISSHFECHAHLMASSSVTGIQ